MASGGKHGSRGARRISSEQTGEESSESDGETEPAKSFHRRLSTNREIKCSVMIDCHFCALDESLVAIAHHLVRSDSLNNIKCIFM